VHKHGFRFRRLFNDVYNIKIIQRWIKGRFMEDELERIRKEAVMGQSKYYPSTCLKGLR
jgi:hypothetical protein